MTLWIRFILDQNYKVVEPDVEGNLIPGDYFTNKSKYPPLINNELKTHIIKIAQKRFILTNTQ